MAYLLWLMLCVNLFGGVTGDDVEEVKSVLTTLQGEADDYLVEIQEIEKLLKTLLKSYNPLKNEIIYKQRYTSGQIIGGLRNESYRIRALSQDEELLTANLTEKSEAATADKIIHIESQLEKQRLFFQKKLLSADKLLQELKNLAKVQTDVKDWVQTSVGSIAEKLQGDHKLKNIFDDLELMNQQVQLQQFNEEEKTRSDGYSGIKQVRDINVGGKTYYSNTFTGKSFAAMHNKENFKNTAGIGEFVAVLNGVEFRTRHNDYELKQAVTDDRTYHKTEDVEHPDVPPEVIAAGDVQAQIAEMKKWFLAFKNQDFSVRDYRKYFPAIMCYLEGAYEEVPLNNDHIDKPLFPSGGRELNADTYSELYEKIRYTSYSGEKERFENLAYLPRTIMEVNETGVPIPAQWGYRILCHKLKNDLPTTYFDLIKDITAQKLVGISPEEYANSMVARFSLQGRDHFGIQKTRGMVFTYQDLLMEEIPGKDNYGASITANGFDSKMLSINPSKAKETLNGAYYHRPYKLSVPDAMGVNVAQRGYSDIFYAAETSQSKVAGPKYKLIVKNMEKTVHGKISFAVPLEVIYLNPLAKWNPYDIAFDSSSTQNLDGKTPGTAFEHNTKDSFYQTPSQFFQYEDLEKIRHAKTISQSTASVHASGVRVILPDIEGVGKVRQRYPIMPVYSEGNPLGKKLNAFEDLFNGIKVEEFKLYATGVSTNDVRHTHIIKIKEADYNDLIENQGVVKTIKTERTRDHEHNIGIKYENNSFFITSCDSTSALSDAAHFCWDGHEFELTTSH